MGECKLNGIVGIVNICVFYFGDSVWLEYLFGKVGNEVIELWFLGKKKGDGKLLFYFVWVFDDIFFVIYILMCSWFF